VDAQNPYAGLLFRKAQLQAQEQAAMGQEPPRGLIGQPPMSQSQFGNAQPKRLTPEQMRRLMLMLQQHRQQ